MQTDNRVRPPFNTYHKCVHSLDTLAPTVGHAELSALISRILTERCVKSDRIHVQHTCHMAASSILLQLPLASIDSLLQLYDVQIACRALDMRGRVRFTLGQMESHVRNIPFKGIRTTVFSFGSELIAKRTLNLKKFFVTWKIFFLRRLFYIGYPLQWQYFCTNSMQFSFTPL